MNQSQIKYARERATAIFNTRKKGLRTAFTIPAVTLTIQEKLKCLRAHRGFTVETLKEGGRAYSVDGFITFNDERPEVFDTEGHDAALKSLNDTYTKLMDELVLGDNQEALKLLQAFENP